MVGKTLLMQDFGISLISMWFIKRFGLILIFVRLRGTATKLLPTMCPPFMLDRSAPQQSGGEVKTIGAPLLTLCASPRPFRGCMPAITADI
jgi:hypothetical protein